MKRKNLTLIALLLLSFITFSEEKIIDVLSITDLHGRVYEDTADLGISKLGAHLKTFNNRGENYQSILLSGGDNYQGSGISNISKGDIISEFFNEVNMKYSAVGNHDTYWGFDYFGKWNKEGDMQYLSANLIDTSTNTHPNFVKPYDILEVQGIKIAFIGLSIARKQLQTNPRFFNGYELTDPLTALNNYSEIAREEGADVIIAIAHIGGQQNQKSAPGNRTLLGEITGEIVPILEGAKDLDGFIAGDSHDLVIGQVNDIPVVQGDTYGKYLANLRITVGNDGDVKSVTPWIDDLFLKKDILEKDEKIETIISKYENLYADKLETEIVQLDNLYKENEVEAKIAKYMKTSTDSNVAIINNASVRSGTPSTSLNYVDMHQILPFDYQVIKLEVKGKELKNILEEKASNGKLTSAGVENKNGNFRFSDGKRIKNNNTYTIVTVDPIVNGVEGFLPLLDAEYTLISDNLRNFIIQNFN